LPAFPGRRPRLLRADGTALVETAGADMGQGAWTALPQIAAASLGVHIDQVEFRSGASHLPDGGVAGGSGHTASAGLALRNASEHALAQLAELAAADPGSPLFGAGNAGFTSRDGRLHHRDDESRSQSFADILARAGRAEVTGSAKAARHPSVAESRALYSHGAVFAEVKVDPDLGQIRVTRLVGAFAAGRIINPHLARSHYLGGMIWGLSFALQEEAITDCRTGRIMNADLAEYLVPVNADAPSVEAILIQEDDPHINALGVKGVGEIGVTGTVGAIANAIWHATGVRVRRYPIRIEDVAIVA
jgi:xanthine dehydrogenase YagR molybdenum-binding subunit